MTQLVEARTKQLADGITVARVLPQIGRRNVGPFVFLDHFGPVHLAPGHGMDVRPHPHIGLATVTWLFDGDIVHRDSLGSEQVIRPGELNWMTAGRGIVHSERTGPASRAAGGRAHGLQLWAALPLEAEETEPAFAHHGADEIPQLDADGVTVHVVAGSAYGATSPVAVMSPLFYVIAELPAGARLPAPAGHAERAVYVVAGAVTITITATATAAATGATGTTNTPTTTATGPTTCAAHQLAVLDPGDDVVIAATEPARIAILGGDPLDAPRHLLWNFVSSSRERLARARDDWKADRFPRVPGDEHERIPFPD